MRPINLIPAEERRRTRGAGSRSGPLPFLLIGGLALLLVGVLMLLHYSNQISDREDNVAQLESERSVATAKAAELAPFTSFVQMGEQRTSTIAELADARFDWPRVIQQLSLILPPDVYFTSMSGSAGGGGLEASAVSVPSLALAGCASSQDAVAGFVATLKQIDGVTRVSLANSSTAEGEEKVSGASPCSAPGTAQFSVLVVFDGAPASPDGAAAVPVEEAPVEGESESTEGEGTEGSSSETESTPESGESDPAQSASTAEGGAAG
jgi:Tfp pilus assembly protein PilN